MANGTAGDTGMDTPRYGDSFEGSFASSRGHEPGLSPGLLAASARQNAAAPKTYTPQSTLSQIGLSPMAQNASAPDMQGRWNAFTGTVLPNTQTGASEDTAETALKLRFAGSSEEA